MHPSTALSLQEKYSNILSQIISKCYHNNLFHRKGTSKPTTITKKFYLQLYASSQVKKNQINYFACNFVHCKNTFSSIKSPFGKNNSHFAIVSSFVSTRYRKGQSCTLINLFLSKSTSTRQVHTCNLSVCLSYVAPISIPTVQMLLLLTKSHGIKILQLNPNSGQPF